MVCGWMLQVFSALRHGFDAYKVDGVLLLLQDSGNLSAACRMYCHEVQSNKIKTIQEIPKPHNARSPQPSKASRLSLHNAIEFLAHLTTTSCLVVSQNEGTPM